MMAAKHSSALVTFSVLVLLFASSCSQMLESAIFMTFAGRLAGANPSLNISSVGYLLVNISIKVIPRLYTSP